MHILLLVTDNKWTEENDLRNYFMINLHESMGAGQNRTGDPCICSQTDLPTALNGPGLGQMPRIDIFERLFPTSFNHLSYYGTWHKCPPMILVQTDTRDFAARIHKVWL